MASLERQILEQMRSDIRGVNGAGSYTFTLNDTDDRVHLFAAFVPDLLPAVLLHFGDNPAEEIAGITPLNAYQRRMSVLIDCFATTTDATPGEAALRALDLAADVRRALESNPRVNDGSSDLAHSMVCSVLHAGRFEDSAELGQARILAAVTYNEVRP